MSYDLYVITDERLSHRRSHLQIAEEAVLGGADVIQLRDKKMCGKDLLNVANGIRACTKNAGVLFIVNDRIDIALASGADGVHLGQEDIPLSSARHLMPSPLIIGISVGSVEEATRAEQGGADYVAVSPVFTTGSKQDAGPGLGTVLLNEIRQAVSIPVIGIGGITHLNVENVLGSGADGIAVISAIISSPDIVTAAKELKLIITRYKSERDEK